MEAEEAGAAGDEDVHGVMLIEQRLKSKEQKDSRFMNFCMGNG